MNDIEVLKLATLRASIHADAMECAVDELHDVIHRLQEEAVNLRHCDEHLQGLLKERQHINRLHRLVASSQLQRAEGAALLSRELPRRTFPHFSLSTRSGVSCCTSSSSSSSVLRSSKKVLDNSSTLNKRENRLCMKNGSDSQKCSQKIRALSSSSSSVLLPSTTATTSSSASLPPSESPTASNTSTVALWRHALTEKEWKKIALRKQSTRYPCRGGDGERGDYTKLFGPHKKLAHSAASLDKHAGKGENQEEIGTKKKCLTQMWTRNTRQSSSSSSVQKNGVDYPNDNDAACHHETDDARAPLSQSNDAIGAEKIRISQEIIMAKHQLAFLDRTSLRNRLWALQSAKAKVLTTPVEDILQGKGWTSTPGKEKASSDLYFDDEVEALWSCDPWLSTNTTTSFLPFVDSLIAESTQRLKRRYEDGMDVLVESLPEWTEENGAPSVDIPHATRSFRVDRSGSELDASTERSTAMKRIPASLDQWSDKAASNHSRSPLPFTSATTTTCNSTNPHCSQHHNRPTPSPTNPFSTSSQPVPKEAITKNKKILSQMKEQRGGKGKPGEEGGVAARWSPSVLSSSSPFPNGSHRVSAFMMSNNSSKRKGETVVKHSPESRKGLPPPTSTSSSFPSSHTSQDEELAGKLSRLRSCYAYAALLTHADNKDAKMVDILERKAFPTNSSSGKHKMDCLYDILCFKGWAPVVGKEVASPSSRCCLTRPIPSGEEIRSSIPSCGAFSSPLSPSTNHTFLHHHTQEEVTEMKALSRSIFSSEDYACLPPEWPWMKEICETPANFLLPPLQTICVPCFSFSNVDEHLVLIKTRMEIQRRIAEQVINGLTLIDVSQETLKKLVERNNDGITGSRRVETIKEITVAEARLFLPKHSDSRDSHAWTTIIEDDGTME